MRPAIVMTEREHLVRAIQDGLRKIEKHQEKIQEEENKLDEREVEVGVALKALKAQKPNGIKWEQYLEDCGIEIHRSRADQLIRIADGRTTVEEERADTAERTAKSRADLPLRSGESACEPEASAEAMRAQFATLDAETECVIAPEDNKVEHAIKERGVVNANPLVAAWANANPKLRSEFVGACWDEIKEARTGMPMTAIYGNGGADENRWMEG